MHYFSKQCNNIFESEMYMMKLTKLVTTAMLTLSLILSFTACSDKTKLKPISKIPHHRMLMTTISKTPI